MKSFITGSYNSTEYILIDEEISNDEILVRYVFTDDFKNKLVKIENIISKELLGPLRGGVSLQREKYSDELKCYQLGKNIPKKELVGFLIFKKEDFENVKSDFILSDDNKVEQKLIDAFIKATPLDENFNTLDFRLIEITTELRGNPAHADIIYIKPKLIPDDTDFYEKPNTIIRSFSKKMYLKCNLVLFKLNGNDIVLDKNFKDYYI